MYQLSRNLLIFLNGFRLIPLWFLLRFKQFVLNDEYAFLFEKDIAHYNVNFWRLLYERPWYKSVLYHRCGNWSKILSVLCGNYPLSIPDKSHTYIGGGIRLDHPYHTILNADFIGSNFTVVHLATIGSNAKAKTLPKLGNDVFLGCGSCILGGVTIGNNVKIGAGTIITKDVPDNVVVVGNPATIVKRNGIPCKEKL